MQCSIGPQHGVSTEKGPQSCFQAVRGVVDLLEGLRKVMELLSRKMHGISCMCAHRILHPHPRVSSMTSLVFLRLPGLGLGAPGMVLRLLDGVRLQSWHSNRGPEVGACHPLALAKFGKQQEL